MPTAVLEYKEFINDNGNKLIATKRVNKFAHEYWHEINR